jgi:hypothetical protein
MIGGSTTLPEEVGGFSAWTIDDGSERLIWHRSALGSQVWDLTTFPPAAPAAQWEEKIYLVFNDGEPQGPYTTEELRSAFPSPASEH